MSESEKLELIEHVARSLQHDKISSDDAATQQISTFLRLQQQLARNPAEPDPFAYLGYSEAAHDAILYQQGRP